MYGCPVPIVSGLTNAEFICDVVRLSVQFSSVTDHVNTVLRIDIDIDIDTQANLDFSWF